MRTQRRDIGSCRNQVHKKESVGIRDCNLPWTIGGSTKAIASSSGG